MERLYFIILIEVIAIVIVEIIICYIIKLQFSYKSERRISEYSISPKEKYNLPWLDRFKFYLNNLIKKLSKMLNKSEVIKKYSRRYNKYINYDEKTHKKPIDYISIKLLFGLFLLILYLISSYSV